MARIVHVVMVCALALGIVGCGGSDTGVSKKQTADDGRVLIRNETGNLNSDSREVDIMVTYTDPSGTPRKISVSPGQVEDVTGDELIKGGERVHLIIEAVQSEGRSSTYKQTVRILTVPVDGNIEIRILAVRDGQQLEGSGFDIE